MRATNETGGNALMRVMVRRTLLLFLVASSGTLNPDTSHAYSKPIRKSWGHLQTQHSAFDDILARSTTEARNELSSILEVEVGFRVFSFFNFIMRASQSVDGYRQEFGLGGRVDMPGFFLFGANRFDLRREARDTPINTSSFMLISQSRYTPYSGLDSQNLNMRFGFTIDFFIFNPKTYLSSNIGVYSNGGDAFMSYGGGALVFNTDDEQGHSIFLPSLQLCPIHKPFYVSR